MKVLPAIVTIDEAIEADSYHMMPNPEINDGDIEGALATADHVIEGKIIIQKLKTIFRNKESLYLRFLETP